MANLSITVRNVGAAEEAENTGTDCTTAGTQDLAKVAESP